MGKSESTPVLRKPSRNPSDSDPSPLPSESVRAGATPDGPGSVLDHAGDLIFTLDATGRVVWINAAADRLSTAGSQGLVGTALADLLAAQSAPALRETLGRIAGGEIVAPIEVDVLRPDGGCTALELDLRRADRAESRVAVLGVGRDLTHRRRADEALRESEERFRCLVENSSDAISLIAPDGLIFYASRPTTRILGYGLESYVGRRFLDFVHPEDRDRLSWVFAEWLGKPGVPVAAEYRYRHLDGSWRHLEAVGVNRLGEAGVGAIALNFRDVTERKRADRARVESEERFRVLFESAPVGIAQLTLDGRIADANRELQIMVGESLDRLRDRPLAEVLRPDDGDLLEHQIERVIAGPHSHLRVERRCARSDGQSFWANLAISVVRDDAATARLCLATIQNISHLKETEAALRESNHRLSASVGSLEQQTRDISALRLLGENLQACRSLAEAYRMLGPAAEQLFPIGSGAIGVIAPTGSMLEPVVAWGDGELGRVFSVDDCWALRRGRSHLRTGGQRGLVCRHVPDETTVTLCVPMVAHGELVGLLSLGGLVPGPHLEGKQQLAETVGEQIALALANLRLHETLKSQSIRDPLTGLFNRRYMEESLEREMRRAVRSGHPVGIIMLDIDHFKRFNDTHGHEAGDVLLRAVGGILQRSVRAEDIACRYGGEEFTLILPEASLDDAANRADYVRESIRALSVQHHLQPLGGVTVSAGVAIFPDHGPNGDAVLRAADSALYYAKSRGRDRVAVHKPSGLFTEGLEELER